MVALVDSNSNALSKDDRISMVALYQLDSLVDVSGKSDDRGVLRRLISDTQQG
jgi:hypothetical protein